MGTGILEDPPNPETPEVLQREILAPALLIHPDGPVSVRELPAVTGAAFTEILSDTTYHKILGGPDPKRKRVFITCDGDIFVSFKQTGGGMRLHGAAAVQGSVNITYQGPIWIAAVTGTVNVGVLVEYWAE